MKTGCRIRQPAVAIKEWVVKLAGSSQQTHNNTVQFPSFRWLSGAFVNLFIARDLIMTGRDLFHKVTLVAK